MVEGPKVFLIKYKHSGFVPKETLVTASCCVEAIKKFLRDWEEYFELGKRVPLGWIQSIEIRQVCWSNEVIE